MSGEVVFTGGPINAVDPPTARTAVAIKGDRIVAVDGGATKMANQGAKKIDLQGRALYPGFIDAHSHWFGDWDKAVLANPDWAGVISPNDSLRRAVESGWTTVTEHFTTKARLLEMQQFDQVIGLPLRISMYLAGNDKRNDLGEWYLPQYSPDMMVTPRLRVAGVKLRVDAGQWYARDPFDPCFGYPEGDRGRFYWDDRTALLARMNAIDRSGFQMSIHCIGDAATDILLDTFENMPLKSPNRRRHSLTHLGALHDDQIVRLKKLRIAATVQFTWFHGGQAARLRCLVGDVHMKFLGRWRDLVEGGVSVAGSTDFPWGVPDIGPPSGPATSALFTATTRMGANGELPPPEFGLQCLTRAQAIAMVTSKAAWALREENLKGALRTGMLADLVVLTEDPMAVAPADLRRIKVALTVVGGKIEYLDPAHSDLAFT